MDTAYIRTLAAKVLIECKVKSFPLDCAKIFTHYGYKLCTYSELEKKNKELYDMCIAYSEDAFRIGNMHLIAYNDKKPKQRIYFSLMHELGHDIIGHKNDLSSNEQEANYFASNILAPRIAIYYAKCKTVKNISMTFHISLSAAYYAAQDFSQWCRKICKNGVEQSDKDLYSHFYNKQYGGFVYSIHQCEFCGATVYNELLPRCRTTCRIPPLSKAPAAFCHDERDWEMEEAVERSRFSKIYNY